MTTIHSTGKAPKTPPWVADRSASPAGILKARMPTARATSRAKAPATWALVLTTARRTKKVSSGSRPTMADQATLFSTGSVLGVKWSTKFLHDEGDGDGFGQTTMVRPQKCSPLSAKMRAGSPSAGG